MVRTRFAPSPTGYLHIGGARTALFSWLYARKHQGKFVLRIEDTDPERSTEASKQAILDGMQWLGLDWDEGPIYQTDRFDRYFAVVESMIESGHAYRCCCSKERLETLRAAQTEQGDKPRYDGHCRELNLPRTDEPHVIRFKTPLVGSVSWIDGVRGEIEFQNSELDDLVMIRSDGAPTYNFAVVVDDIDMNITHIIRGDDHINNTPRQIHLYEALQKAPPVFAHVPMILGGDGKRLSKRHGAMSVMEYRDQGFLPEAVLNYLVRLGWSCGDEELFTKDQMIEKFSLQSISRSPAAFNLDKLLWINQHYLRTLPVERIEQDLQFHLNEALLSTRQGPPIKQVIAVMTDRVKTLKEMVEHIRYFYEDVTAYDSQALDKVKKGDPLGPLNAVKDAFLKLDQWTVEGIHHSITQTAEALGCGMGKVGMPLRLALTGGLQSPSIDVTTHLIGREKAVYRIEQFLKHL